MRRNFRTAAALLPLVLVASCNPWKIFGIEDEDEDALSDTPYGYVEIWDRFSTPLTDRLPDRTVLTAPGSGSGGSGIGAAASEPRTGIGVVVGNVDASGPCAQVGRTCVVTQGSSVLVSLTYASAEAGVAQWIAIGGEVTLVSRSPVRYRLNNLQMRKAPYEGNAASGSFYMKGEVKER